MVIEGCDGRVDNGDVVRVRGFVDAVILVANECCFVEVFAAG